MILVDTSVWIDHFRLGDDVLAYQLSSSSVLMHPFVLGELACGNLKQRKEVLSLLNDLPESSIATDKEVLFFIEKHNLMGKGIGYIDTHLLAAVALDNSAQLWTRDKRLGAVGDLLSLSCKMD